MCAWVIRTASIERGSKGGSCQLRSRSSLRPWNIPQSTKTFALSLSTKYFDPVTVPTPPQNEIVAKETPYSSLNHVASRFQTPNPSSRTEQDKQDRDQ